MYIKVWLAVLNPWCSDVILCLNTTTCGVQRVPWLCTLVKLYPSLYIGSSAHDSPLRVILISEELTQNRFNSLKCEHKKGQRGHDLAKLDHTPIVQRLDNANHWINSIWWIAQHISLTTTGPRLIIPGKLDKNGALPFLNFTQFIYSKGLFLRCIETIFACKI